MKKVITSWMMIIIFGALMVACDSKKPMTPQNPNIYNLVTGSQIKNVVPIGVHEQAQIRVTYGAPYKPPVYNAYRWNYPDDAYYQSTKVFIYPNDENCADYWVTALINGQENSVYATICQLPDRTWRVMQIKRTAN